MTPRAASPKILIVDDEIQVLTLFQFLLEDTGYQVTTADCGKAAVAALAEERFDLLVLDMGLPDLDSFDLLRLARRQAPEMKVMVASGYVSDGIAKMAVYLGAACAVQKPVSPQVFLETIDSLLAA